MDGRDEECGDRVWPLRGDVMDEMTEPVGALVIMYGDA